MKEQLFRHVTRRICGSLDFDEALHEVFLYLQKIMPLDGIAVSIYEPVQRMARVIGISDEHCGYLLDESFPLSAVAWETIFKWLEESRSGTIPWIRNHTHPLNQETLRIARMHTPSVKARAMEEFCSITCALTLKRTIVGNLTFIAEGQHHYTTSHADIIKEINEPFAIALSNALRYMDLVRDHKALQRDAIKISGDTMIGAEGGLRGVTHLMDQVARKETPILLLGETGTGKEVVAAQIHNASQRAKAPFIRLNCGAIPESLMDSELFGHEKGAFTGALETRAGRFERASGGTLFLDEIGELPLAAQAKLLRVLQNGEFERVGGGRSLHSNARIIAATHRNLPAMVKEGRFREDLWYRLAVFPIRIPSLRERKQDIPAMVHHFIRMKCEEMNLPFRPGTEPGEMKKLLSYTWPGNVRELQNIVERALILSEGRPLHFGNLMADHHCLSAMPFPCESETNENLDAAMEMHIRTVLKKSHGRVSGPDGAAERLGLHPSTLRSRMKKMGIPYERANNIYRPEGHKAGKP
ncbi:sigma 54-interacting transcriptional regulator [Desulfobotulus sp. H1]|uniref:Sigma 54-interacting transcriptional regulator n=1 Tax=Desulfobotulus pelophilus TaxID=2823377 RepID=A0ABT3NCV0_9BACT|nr:sigma 54-interacting transcriptional regulator [Desulfobotulus pelophilus]MCW7755294.1 sigma 54-interacting transcriptional regulator [Desulfobotulus pelophilus]